MVVLSPPDVHALSSAAYATLGSRNPAQDAAERAGQTMRNRFAIDAGTVFQSSSVFERAPSNYGFVAFDKSQNNRNHDAVICIRGTQIFADVVIDASFAMEKGPSGNPVHKGFNQLGASIAAQVVEALRGRNVTNLHIMGHSLGGATGTVLADALSGVGVGGVTLYTIGAPRVGDLNHTAFLTGALGRENIYRVYNDTDPVPMLPMFPYAHCPAGETAYLLEGTGAIVWPPSHKMGAYHTAMAGTTWGSLPVIRRRRFSIETVDDVLEEAGHLPGGYLSSALMRLIVKALQLILKALNIGLGMSFLGLATIIDVLAYVLRRGISLVGKAIDGVIGLIMRFLGLPLRGNVEVTQNFIRWLLQKLARTIGGMAGVAVRLVF